MKLKKWENPRIVSLNVIETKTSQLDEPHSWECPRCQMPIISPELIGDRITCPQPGCDADLIWVGDGQHPTYS